MIISCIHDMEHGCQHIRMGDEYVKMTFERWDSDSVVRGAWDRLRNYFEVTDEANLMMCDRTATTTRLFLTLFYRINNLHKVRGLARGSVFA